MCSLLKHFAYIYENRQQAGALPGAEVGTQQASLWGGGNAPKLSCADALVALLSY